MISIEVSQQSSHVLGHWQVALYNFYFVPGTDDLVTIMSVRVRPSFQGQGFGRPEKNPITDQFRRDHPKVTRYIIQTMFKPNIQAKIHQWKQLYHWVFNCSNCLA